MQMVLLCIFVGMIFLLAYMGVDENSTLAKSDKLKNTINNFFNMSVQKEQPNESKCRDRVEAIFNARFSKVRPKWLRNPVTNRCLELDMYNEDLQLAFEYDGAQHNHFTPHFHKTRDQFEYRKLLDNLKSQLCKDHGVLLVRIPYYVTADTLHPFLFGVAVHNTDLAKLMRTVDNL